MSEWVTRDLVCEGAGTGIRREHFTLVEDTGGRAGKSTSRCAKRLYEMSDLAVHVNTKAKARMAK